MFIPLLGVCICLMKKITCRGEPAELYITEITYNYFKGIGRGYIIGFKSCFYGDESCEPFDLEFSIFVDAKSQQESLFREEIMQNIRNTYPEIPLFIT